MTPVEDAFVRELNQHIGIAHRISRVYFTDADDRRDALQEMMYQLWRSYPRFAGHSKFSTWMYKVCLNTALTYKRKNRNTNETLSASHQQIAQEEKGAEDESITLLFDAIAALSPLNKTITLLYLEGMSYEDIASLTGLTKSNVSVRLVRIKKELETMLKPTL